MSDTPLTRHPCTDGGVLCELYREADYGQINMRLIPVGITAGGHIHPRTDEWWLVMRGVAEITLRWDDGRELVGRRLGELPEIQEIPRNVWHEIKNVGDEEIVLIYWASRVYDPEKPDKVTTWPTL